MNTKQTQYHKDTPDAVKRELENLRVTKNRVRIFYGNGKTGKSWHEEHDIMGTISRSTGWKPIPILIHNSRSYGGGAILDHCIVKILDTASGRTLYQHKNFDGGKWELKTSNEELPYKVYVDSTNHANFKTEKQAKNYIKFMKGERFSK